MRARIVASGMFLILVGVSPIFGQALAEGAMVHAAAGAGGVKAGSALGNALNKANSQIGHQLHSVTQPTTGTGKPQNVPQSTSQQQTTIGTTTNSSSSGSLITSIHGAARKTCPSVPAAAGTQAATQDKSSPAVTPSQPADCVPQAAPQSQSKSVINLTFSQ